MSSELRFVKWVFFEWNCIVKFVIFIAIFCWLWDFLLENLKLKRNSEDVRGNVWTNIKKLYSQKKNSKYDILNHLYFDPNFYFGDCFRAFLLVSFFIFVVDQPWSAPFPPPHHKKVSYGPGSMVFCPLLNFFFGVLVFDLCL